MMEGVGRRSGTEPILDLGDRSISGNERNGLFRNNGDGSFTDVAWLNGADRQEDGRGVAIFDFDRDGRLDIAIRNYLQPAALLHNIGPKRQWVSFELVGTQSNRDAVGAHIRLRTGDLWQTRVVTAGSGYLSANSLRQHFGLGSARLIDEVVITWPSGLETHHNGLTAGNSYRIIEQDSLGQVSSPTESTLQIGVTGLIERGPNRGHLAGENL